MLKQMLVALTLGIALGMARNAPVAASSQGSDAFSDIASHWSRHVINWLAGQNPAETTYLETSASQFQPGCPISRGDWVALASPIFNLESRPSVGPLDQAPPCSDGPGKCPFTDIAAASPWHQTTYEAFRTGLMSGYPDGSFRPEQPLTYAEAVVSLAALLELVPQIEQRQQQYGEAPATTGTDYFINGQVMADAWFAPALHGALLANLVALDFPLEFYPQRPPLSRGEAATMMYLGLVYQDIVELDETLLRQETSPGQYAFRHLRQAGEPDFIFGPPAFRRQCAVL